VPSTKGGPKHSDSQAAGGKGSAVPDGLKPKDLIGIPWRVAFALQAAGWYLRQDIIWHKPNPMPESVTDRCTKAHEYMFLLSKSERYYFDAKAIAQPIAESSKKRLAQPNISNQTGSDRAPGKTNGNMKAVGPRFGGNKYGDDDRDECRTKSGNEYTGGDGLANRRSVWTIPTKPYKGAHFATFPPALIEPCILAGSRVGDTVLDPFMGSGTTAQVSQTLGRNWIGCEINEEYAPLQQKRIDSSPTFEFEYPEWLR
jgi:DNA modification methylase